MDTFNAIIEFAHRHGYRSDFDFSEFTNPDGASCTAAFTHENRDSFSFYIQAGNYPDLLLKIHKRLAFYLTFPDTELNP